MSDDDGTYSYTTDIEPLVRAASTSPASAARVLDALEGVVPYSYSSEQVADLIGAYGQVDEEELGEDEVHLADYLALLETPEERTERIRAAIMEKIVPTGAPREQQDGWAMPGVDRNAHYDGEDTGMTWRTANDAMKDSDAFVTNYEDRATLEDRAAGKDESGRILDAQGNLMNGEHGWVVDAETGLLLFFDPSSLELTAPDGTTSVTTLSAVIARFGSLRAAIDGGHKLRSTHHTTPGAGAPVSGAGLMKLENGYIVEINDQSGHYRPDAEAQWETVQGMTEAGVSMTRPAGDNPEDFREAQIKLTGDSGGGRPTDKAGWLGEAHDQNEYFPTGDVHLSASQFEQTGGNERQIRNKDGLNREFEDTVAGRLRARAEQGAVEGRGRAGEDDEGDDGEGGEPVIGGYVEWTPEQRQYVLDARGYLQSAGQEAFVSWYRSLPEDGQELLRQDEQLGVYIE